ncbi:type 1 glutamine amidotransferase domain-containing protein [Holzapfeliella sp. JNUCC 80]
MSKIAVIVTNFVEDIEYTSPVEALEAAGHEVITIENEANKTFEGKNGTKIHTDLSIDDTNPSDFDGLLIPGGFSPDILRADNRYVEFTKHFFLSNKAIFAICHGPQIFIQTGLTKGRKMTAYNSVLPDLYYAGAITEDKAVVIDENLVTSRTPDDLDDFNNAIVKVLN